MGGVWSCKTPKALNPPTHRGGMVLHYYEGKLQFPYYFHKKLQFPYYCKIAIPVPKSGACFAIAVLFPKENCNSRTIVKLQFPNLNPGPVLQLPYPNSKKKSIPDCKWRTMWKLAILRPLRKWKGFAKEGSPAHLLAAPLRMLAVLRHQRASTDVCSFNAYTRVS